MSTIKLHNDHAATCLCCVHFELEAGGGEGTNYDYPEVTCNKHVFNTRLAPDENDIHTVIQLAQTCNEFEGRT